jgi:hypothetical protein
MRRIPKVLHYCFGYDSTFGGKPWSLVHYVCVKSAIDRIKPDRAYLYYEYEPQGVWWERTRTILTPVKIRAPREIFGNTLRHVAHRSDIVRLEVLLKQGGIYLDADVFVHSDFDHLLDHSVVLGQEGSDARIGLCNAIIAAEPGAQFLKRWYEEYRWFRSKGRDDYWNEHSVLVPLNLSKKYPTELTVLPHKAFYWPLSNFEGLKLIFGQPASDEKGTLANHLWESIAWQKYLEHLTPGKVRDVDSSFHRWARPFVSDLPRNYGQPSLAERCGRAVRVLKTDTSERLDWIKTKIIRSRQLGLSATALKIAAKLLPTFSTTTWHRRHTFQQIYKEKRWGSSQSAEFFSGYGSRGSAAEVYVERMAHILNERIATMNRSITVVDLGCGDFEIGRQLTNKIGPINYVGCDIVPELVAHHSIHDSCQRVQFKTLDIVADELPEGDICLIRQVFQHLSNADIKKVLAKLSKFSRVYVTEGYPLEEVGPPNPDKPTDHNVRFDWREGRGRGVELDKEPYGLATRELFRVRADAQQEVIATFEVDCSGAPFLKSHPGNSNARSVRSA